MSGIFEIQFDMRELVAAVGDEAFALRTVDRFLIQAGGQIQSTWVLLAQAMSVRESGSYIAGIESDESVQIIQPARRDGPIVTGVVEVTARAAHSRYVEEGHVAFHLPDKINWGGPSVKTTKTGKRLLHIPFRHAAYDATPTASGLTTATRRRMMPAAIYAEAKDLTRTVKKNEGPIRSSDGKFTQADRYAWGNRLHGVSRAGFLSSKAGNSENLRSSRQVGWSGKKRLVNPAWGSSKFEGMFKGGSEGGTQYMTIRTITPDSPGWNIPAKQGLWLARKVATFIPTQLSEILQASVLGGLDTTS